MVLMQPFLVFGAGGYARCVVDAILAAGGAVEALVDHNPVQGAACMGRPIWREEDVLNGKGAAVACIAIGDNARRQWIVERVRAQRPDIAFPTVIHPRATIASSAVIEDGSVILAGAVINPMARLGLQASIYSNVVVEHDCELDEYVTLAPAAALGGAVRLGARTFIGLGAVISHGVSIGADAVVGAGATVLSDQRGEQIIVGSPARAIRQRQRGEAYL